MCPAKVSDDEPPHPRETTALFGHAEAEQTLLEAYRGGRIPHAWLIGGERGIGKATLAYRLARFVLANPDPKRPTVQKATSLAVPPDHPSARRIAGQAHSDLLVLERVVNEKTGKLFTETRVDQVRQSVSFFGSTAGEGGWRVAIVDPIEDLNKYGINALLKVLEEPPQRALLLLITDAPGRVLPTIRSRCRTLILRPLAAEDVARATAMALVKPAALIKPAALGEANITDEIRDAAAAAGGSVGRALTLLEGDALELRQRMVAVLERLPEIDPRALHALGDGIAGTDAETLAAFMDTVNAWLGERLNNGPQQVRRLARIADVWSSVNKAGREAEAYNLDRKPFVFSVFGQLADAARA
jgi:DNA polymerase III subunit delta'